ncbi:uncharacterized protein FOMMEDRAFT_29783 [Fomitiporia mediterranea MF3/22]|uniref:uncharacterized protein n=1 Tax=Fomitiporia mediterranea (strain MF3/22) TaxID=694068 RepID=UPI0004409372|nr:uncharacterized protein FOMMEDRAFT_29783 [Fomitiporia mediterranea MF3/22]EJD00996.1 hypothetical protein FOMMEDRAFT_29783 [Fomitiporia mediterranea MF3/22]
MTEGTKWAPGTAWIVKGYNPNSRTSDLEFMMKDEVATLPRVSEVIIICPTSPWCTITLKRIFSYAEHALTEAEFSALPQSIQDRVRRSAIDREALASGVMGGWNVADFPYNRCKRIDWLRDKVLFDSLERDDSFSRDRLGYAAPNVFKIITS